MRLRERYRRLTLWNKVAFWGSVASVAGLAITLAVVLWPASERVRPPIHVTKVDFSMPTEGAIATANVHYRVTAPSVRVSANSTLFCLTPRSNQTDWEIGLDEAWTLATERWTEIGPERVVSEGDVYFTVARPPLLKTEINDLLAGSAALFLAGRMKYAAESEGIIEFCFFWKSGAKFFCPAHNGPPAR